MTSTKAILVPTDFSDQSKKVLDYACDLARRSEATLHLLHVADAITNEDELADLTRDRLEQIARSIDERSELDLETLKRAVVGDPHRKIAEYARENLIDLIVMGTHGRTGLAHLTLGSVAERVVRHAPCPVLVVRGDARKGEATCHTAIQILRKELGTCLESSSLSGVDKMCAILEDKLHVGADTSRRLVKELQRREWISWQDGEPGQWSLREDTESLAEQTAIPFNPQRDSQAVDLIDRARRLRATDVHLDPSDRNETLVRLRIDGRLEEYCRLDAGVGEHLANQLKTLSDISIAEPFYPKEGRVRLPSSSLADMEVRITTAPVAGGEAVALRLFDRDNIFLPLNHLGMSDGVLQSVHQMLKMGEGLVLITGPTGSGKTTTVYSMLESLGGIDRNVVSVEDPVEFAVPFVRQMNVDPHHGITMTSGLRTILRMDPDVVFLGEIRDSEAARIAMRAASSGKYVLSTLHTRDIASTITALRDMGITDRSMAGNLTGIINQRLVRRLCPVCKRAVDLEASQLERFSVAEIIVPEKVFLPVGCEACRATGFQGRIGVFEAALIRNDVSAAITTGASERELYECLRSSGVRRLTADALTKVAAGITSLPEALSVHWLN